MGRERRTNYEKHGLSHHPLQSVWRDMKSRCYDENNKFYHNYGGRGIVVCGQWIDSVLTFHNDMIVGYSRGLELDRIDNDGPYSKENCRWVTKNVNGANRRSKGKYLKGAKPSLSKWSSNIKVFGKNYYIGTYDTELEAHNAYIVIRKEWYGF